MRIKYVVSTMIFWGREHPLSFEQECQFLKSLGFGVELLANIKGYSECRYERRNWSRLAEATKDMLVSMRTRNDRPGLEQWHEQIECARLLKANIVTDLRALRISDDPGADGYDFAGEVVKAAELNDVRLCLETGQLPVLKKVGEKFDSIAYCLDTGYANLDLKYAFRRYVDDLAERVLHLHLTDNYGQHDDHEAPGLRGGIPREDWDYVLKALGKYENEVVGSFEMCPCVPAVMIRKASEFLFDVLQWPDPPQSKRAFANLDYNPA
ncbi:MAG: sugar phosphate isomerase/epimerase family protein [Planctomycetota bacterium]|jgi:sugar phosphate isomerase/epimerase